MGFATQGQVAGLLVPHHTDFDRLHSALTGTIIFIFPHRDLPLIGTGGHTPSDGVLLPRQSASDKPNKAPHRNELRRIPQRGAAAIVSLVGY